MNKELPDFYRTVFQNHVNLNDVIAYGRMGSHLYNLQNESSDVDLTIITFNTPNKQLFKDKYDLRIQNFNSFLKTLQKNSVDNVDLICSKEFTVTDKRYESFLQFYRPNKFQYYENSESLIYNTFKQFNQTLWSQPESLKTLRHVFRFMVLSNRMMNNYINFNPRFTDNERNRFFNQLDSFQHDLKNQFWSKTGFMNHMYSAARDFN